MRVPGFTALELLLVIAATAVLTLLVSIPLSILETQQGLTSAVAGTVQSLRRVQTEAMSGYYAANWGVHLSNSSGCALPASKIWTYESSTFDSASDTTDAFSLPNGNKITAISVGGGCDVVFARFAGTTSASGTITVTDPNGNSKIIAINSYGRISPP